jgi:pimeloyl-ACP methyl ester carboxylesterase
MRKSILLLFLFGMIIFNLNAQSYSPVIEPCPCLMKTDARLKTVCGNLIVPENRQNPNGNKIKIPFVFARKPEQDSVHDIVLFTTGGPGYATIIPGDSLPYNSPLLTFGGYIFFDQRGTKNARPCLDCEGIDEAIKRSYQENLSRDSLINIAVTNCRNKFVKQGIDLSAYNTLESAADINDLRKTLHIESLILNGVSYSGGLMLTVARNYPEGIKSLLLNSPLPGFVNYEEHALFNVNEALNKIFDNVETDSVQSSRFPGLRQNFHNYFESVSGKHFTISYQENEKAKPINIQYTKNELLDAIINKITNSDYQNVPLIIRDIVNGKHEKYIKEVLDEKFAGNKALTYGMRLSVYCSEQMAFADNQLIKKQEEILPWLAGYPVNNVTAKMCDCWKVIPEPRSAKTPVYSKIPALISMGDLDPWTRPIYSRLIKRTMPNSQLLMISGKAHGAGYGQGYLGIFFQDPYKRMFSNGKNVVVE